MTEHFKCFICDRPEILADDWSPQSLKFIYGNGSKDSGFKLCTKHAEFCKEKIATIKTEPKKYVLKETPQFMPPIPKEPIKNYQDREPGSDDI